MPGHKLFQLIDLDRTLFNTALFVEHISQYVDRERPGMGTELQQQFETAYQNEQTFFILTYLRELFGDEWFEAMVQNMVAEYGAEAYMQPGARERLELAGKLSDLQPGWGILTYGNPKDQALKLAIAGLQDAPVYIADIPDKGGLIAGWKQVDGSYVLPVALTSERVELLSFEDDKLRAFQDLPEDVIGIWLTQYDGARARTKLQASQLEGVSIAQNLLESAAILKSALK